jgi:hypothetical protein
MIKRTTNEEQTTLPLKRGRKPKCAEVEFIIPENIQGGLVILSPPLKKHARRPPL